MATMVLDPAFDADLIGIQNTPARAARSTKCEHGVYIPEDEQLFGTSSYCPQCNPNLCHDSILRNSMKQRRPVIQHKPEPRVLDAAEYMNQSPEQRLRGAHDFVHW